MDATLLRRPTTTDSGVWVVMMQQIPANDLGAMSQETTFRRQSQGLRVRAG